MDLINQTRGQNGRSGGRPQTRRSETCISLNPSPHSIRSSKMPVMLFIHLSKFVITAAAVSHQADDNSRVARIKHLLLFERSRRFARFHHFQTLIFGFHFYAMAGDRSPPEARPERAMRKWKPNARSISLTAIDRPIKIENWNERSRITIPASGRPTFCRVGLVFIDEHQPYD